MAPLLRMEAVARMLEEAIVNVSLNSSGNVSGWAPPSSPPTPPLPDCFTTLSLIGSGSGSGSGSTSGSGAGSGSGSQSSHGHAFEAVVFVALAVFIGAVIAQTLSRFAPWVPYTPTLLVIGILLNVWNHGMCKGGGGGNPLGADCSASHLHPSIEMWENIDGHTILFVFLPPLLFADSMNLQWNLTIRCIGQCLLLAGPGVLIGTVLNALVAQWIMGFDFQLSMAYGAIQAATDPVAAVALLNDLGAPASLTMIISGESLLNDGTAMVVYQLFLGTYLGDTIEPVSFLLKLVGGGVGIGLCFGVGTLFWISLLNHRHSHTDVIIQIAVTIVSSYMCFYVSEGIAGASGVLAVVTMGTMLAALFWPLVINRHTMEHVWHTLEWLFNTVLFQVAGLIIGKSIATQIFPQTDASKYADCECEFHKTQNSDLSEIGKLEGTDVALTLVSYVGAVAIRGCVMLLLFPLLRRLGYGMSRADAAVSAWGGLHGSVGLALAMALKQEISSRPCGQRIGERVLLHVACVAVLTLTVNAPLMAPLLRVLKLTGESKSQAQAFADLKARVSDFAWREYQKMLYMHTGHDSIRPETEYWRHKIPEFISLMAPENDGDAEDALAAGGTRGHDFGGMRECVDEQGHHTFKPAARREQSATKEKRRRNSDPAARDADRAAALKLAANRLGVSTASKDDEQSHRSIFSLLDDNMTGALAAEMETAHVDMEAEVKTGEPSLLNGRRSKKGLPPAPPGCSCPGQWALEKMEEMQKKKVEMNDLKKARGAKLAGPSGDEDDARSEAGSCASCRSRASNASMRSCDSQGIRRLTRHASIQDLKNATRNLKESTRRTISRVSHSISDHLHHHDHHAAMRRKFTAKTMLDSDAAARLVQARKQFLQLLKQAYTNMLEDGVIPPSFSVLATDLTMSVDLASDRIRMPLYDWSVIVRNLRVPLITRLMIKLPDWSYRLPGLSKIFWRHGLDAYEIRATYLLTCFVTAHEQAQDEMHWMFGQRKARLHREEVKVVAESRTAVREAKAYLHDLAMERVDGHDLHDLVDSVRARQMASFLIHRVERLVMQMHTHGILDGKSAERLLHQCEGDQHKLQHEVDHVQHERNRHSVGEVAKRSIRDALERLKRVNCNHAKALEAMVPSSVKPIDVTGSGTQILERQSLCGPGMAGSVTAEAQSTAMECESSPELSRATANSRATRNTRASNTLAKAARRASMIGAGLKVKHQADVGDVVEMSFADDDSHSSPEHRQPRTSSQRWSQGPRELSRHDREARDSRSLRPSRQQTRSPSRREASGPSPMPRHSEGTDSPMACTPR